MIASIKTFAIVAAATVMTSGLAQAGCKTVKIVYGW